MNILKSFFLWKLFLVGLFFTSSVFAQYVPGTWWEVGTFKWVPLDDPASTYGVNFVFCDSENNRQVDSLIVPGEEEEICVRLSNDLDIPLDITIDVTDGKSVPHSQIENNVDCDLSTNKFAQFVDDWPTTVTVPPQSREEVRTTMSFPAEVGGEVLWCISVHKARDEWDGESMKAIARIANGIRVLVESEISVGLQVVPLNNGKNLSSNDNIFVTQWSDGEYSLSVWVENVGTLSQDVSAEVVVKDMLWNVILSDSASTKLSAKKMGTLDFTIPEIPWFKWLFDVEATITHQATTSIQSSMITDEMLTEKTKNVTWGFFVFPWRLVAVLAALFLIIRLIAQKAKKAKKEHEELEQLKHYKEEHEHPQQQQQQ